MTPHRLHRGSPSRKRPKDPRWPVDRPADRRGPQRPGGRSTADHDRSVARLFALWGVAAAGAVLTLLAAALFSDLLEFTDFVFVERGHLSFRLPVLDRAVATPVILEGTYATIQRAAPFAIMISAAAVAVALGLWRDRILVILRAWPSGPQGWAAILLLGAVLAAYLPLGDRGGALAVYAVVASAGFLMVVVGLASTRAGAAAGSTLARSARWMLGPGLGDRTVAAILAASVLLMASGISLVVFQGVPHTLDGISQLFQARIFATGRLFLPSPALHEFFDIETMVNNGRWFSQYTPGHTVLLMIGDQVGAPWLVNPVLGAATVPVIYALGTAAHGPRTGRLAAMLLVVSPFFLLMSADYFNHASTLLFLGLFLLFYVRFHESRYWGHAVVCGLCLGLAVGSRPLTALAFAIPTALHGIVTSLRERSTARIPGYAVSSLVTLALVGMLLVHNHMTTGSATTFGYGQAVGPGYGFGSGIQWSRTLSRVRAFNFDVLGWPVPVMILPLFAFLGGKVRSWDYLWMGIFFTLLAAYATTTYRDSEFGPRYLYEAAGPILLLSARGLLEIARSISRMAGRRVDPAKVKNLTGLAVGAAVATAVALAVPTRLGFYGSPAWSWALPHEAVDRVRRQDLNEAVVFVRGERLWEALFLDNALSLDTASVIFARDLGERNEELTRRYSDWRWFVADTVSLRPMDPGRLQPSEGR